MTTPILLAGDTHKDARHIAYLARCAVEHGCTLIIQVGDFGFFPNTTTGREFLGQVEQVCDTVNIELWWLPGNHDDWGHIRNSVANADGKVTISPHVKLLPQGCRFTLEGIRFGCLGGAFSVDWRRRTPGKSWWPDDEKPNADDLVALGTDPVDVLLTHDAPIGISLPGWSGLPIQDKLQGEEVREYVKAAVLRTRPNLLVHGHWHYRHSTEVNYPDPTATELTWIHARVEGLAENGKTTKSWTILDLPTLSIHQ